jgi:predicted aldo/keto reductase-like oxidoreductase
MFSSSQGKSFPFQMTFGEQNTEKEAHDILAYSFDQGINIIDTAEIVSTDSFLTSINYPSLCFQVK